MDFTEEQHTEWFPGTEKPGEDGLYKRRKKASLQTDYEPGPVMYCLWEDGWWYEGSTELSSALNTPLRKSHYQPDHWIDFEWCGVMPGSYERPDVQAVKTANFVGGFFAPNPELQCQNVTVVAPKTLCSICGEEQFDSPSGVTCKNGHGGAEPLDITDEKQREEAFANLEEPAAINEEQQFNADFFGEQP